MNVEYEAAELQHRRSSACWIHLFIYPMDGLTDYLTNHSRR